MSAMGAVIGAYGPRTNYNNPQRVVGAKIINSALFDGQLGFHRVQLWRI